MPKHIGFGKAFWGEYPDDADAKAFGSHSDAHIAMAKAQAYFAVITGILTLVLGLMAFTLSPSVHIPGYAASFFFLRFGVVTFLNWVDADPATHGRKRPALALACILGLVYFGYCVLNIEDVLKATF